MNQPIRNRAREVEGWWSRKIGSLVLALILAMFVAAAAHAEARDAGSAAIRPTATGFYRIVVLAQERPHAEAVDTGGYTGRLRFYWTTRDGTVYDATLTAAGDRGMVNVGYADRAGRRHEVTEDVTLYRLNGVYFVGSNPRDADTGTSIATYHPDTFRIQIASDGGWTVTQACDDQECSQVVR